MNKLDYLKNSISLKLYTRRDWLISCFSIINKPYNKQVSYINEIFSDNWGYNFIDNKDELIKIENTTISTPLFSFKEKINIDSSWISNLDKPIETTIGNLLVNLILIVSCFGNKIKYLEGKISIKDIEDIITQKLHDNTEDNKRSDEFLYVDEYVKFIDAIQFLSSISQLCTIGVTRKLLTPPTGLKEFKDKLKTKYEGKLTDSTELANFEKELSDFDEEYLKDDPANGKFLRGKIKNVARKKMFLTMGADKDFENNIEANPVINSLHEKWPTNPKEFTAMMNGLRSGSYSRGSETVKGGVAAKTLLRSSNNFIVVDGDCSTTLGLKRNYSKINISKLIGRYIIEDKTIFIETIEQANLYIDKDIIIRSPMYCKEKGETICEICAGSNLSKYRNGLAIPVTELSSIILSTSLSAMHGKVLSINKMDLNRVFS